MPSILFVCTGNQFRSPIAAACFKRLLAVHHADNGWVVESAGTWATDGDRPLPKARAAAARLGMNIDAHRTRIIREDMVQNFDLIVVMEGGQKEALCLEFPLASPHVHLLTEISGELPGDIPDPYSSPLDAFEIMQDMCNLLKTSYARIKQLAEDLAESRI